MARANARTDADKQILRRDFKILLQNFDGAAYYIANHAAPSQVRYTNNARIRIKKIKRKTIGTGDRKKKVLCRSHKPVGFINKTPTNPFFYKHTFFLPSQPFT